MERVWWDERSARLHEAATIVSAQADCSVDAALLLLKRRAQAMGCDLEEIAASVIERRVRYYADPSTEAIDYGEVVNVPHRVVSVETARCEWQSELEGKRVDDNDPLTRLGAYGPGDSVLQVR